MLSCMGVSPLHKDLELPICPDLFHMPMRNQTPRNASCIHTAYAFFIVCQFSLPTVEPCVKIKPENT
jgi:hypothetical protein